MISRRAIVRSSRCLSALPALAGTRTRADLRAGAEPVCASRRAVPARRRYRCHCARGRRQAVGDLGPAGRGRERRRRHQYRHRGGARRASMATPCCCTRCLAVNSSCLPSPTIRSPTSHRCRPVRLPQHHGVPNNSPAHSVTDFIAHAKANLGKICLPLLRPRHVGSSLRRAVQAHGRH